MKVLHEDVAIQVASLQHDKRLDTESDLDTLDKEPSHPSSTSIHRRQESDSDFDTLGKELLHPSKKAKIHE